MDYIGRALVSDALQEWREQLHSHATVSPLRDVVATHVSLVDLRQSHPSGLAQLFAGRPTPLTALLRDEQTRLGALHRGRLIVDEAERVQAATGAWTAAMAIGTVAWEEHGARVEMPLLLRGVGLERFRENDVHVTLRDDVWVNPVFLTMLRERAARASMEPPRLPAVTPGRDFDPRPLWHAVKARTDLFGAALEVPDRLVLGAYDDPEQRLIDDLDDCDPIISASTTIAAAAGDQDAIAELSEPLPAFPKGDRDPFAERGIGDLDDIQFAVLDLIATGRDVFLHTPPGADAVGMAAALGADGAASGRTTVIVGGESSSLRAVGARLAALGAGDLVIDGTVDAWNAQARARLLEAITMGTPDVDDHALRTTGERLLRSRATLHRRFDALHRSHRPWGVSAFEAVQAIVRLTTSQPAPATSARLGADAGAVVADQGFASVAAALATALAGGEDDAPEPEEVPEPEAPTTLEPWWKGHAEPEEATRLDEALAAFSGRSVPKMRSEAALAAHETGVDEAHSFAMWAAQVRMFEAIREILEVFSPAVFHRSLTDLVAATAPHGSKRFQAMPRRDRRALMRRAVELLRPGRGKETLHDDLVRAHELARQWRSHCSAGGWPVVPDDFDVFADRLDKAEGEWAVISSTVAAVTGNAALDEEPWEDLEDDLARLARGVPGSLESSEITDVEIDVDEGGFAALVADLRERHASPEQIRRDLEFAWWAAAFDAIVATEPSLTDYGALEEAFDTFRRHDSEFSAARIGPLMRAVGERRRAAIARHPDVARDLFAALVEGGHASIKELWRDFGPLVSALRPVVLANAEQVSRMVPATRAIDTAVVVAAESLALAELVPTLARAKQVVVIGDSLSATRSAVAALATMLPHVTLHAMPQPRDPRVASVLSETAYGRALSTLPAAGKRGQLRVNVLDSVGAAAAGHASVESTHAEVAAVVDYVEGAHGSLPRRSLVVIAGNDLHTARVADALAERSSRLAAAVPVVTLGEAAGYRADEAVLTLGFARDTRGVAPSRLGALSESWGKEALVQALTSGVPDVTVFSALAGSHLSSADAAEGHGVDDLRDLIAAADTDPVAPERPEPAPSDWLIADVAQRLRRDGYGVHVRYGNGADAIPMVVGGRHDRDYAVAVVTDEAAPAGSASLRDRVRWQRAQLEALGWTVVPLWTLDVFMDPDAAAEQVRAALPEERKKARDAAAPVQPALDLELGELGEVGEVDGDDDAAPDHDAAELEVDEDVVEPPTHTLGLSTLLATTQDLGEDAEEPESEPDAEAGNRSDGSAEESEDAPAQESEEDAEEPSLTHGREESSDSEEPASELESEPEAGLDADDEPDAEAGDASDGSAEESEDAPAQDSEEDAEEPSLTHDHPPAPKIRPAGVDRPLIPTRASEDRDEGWGGSRESGSRDEEILRERPPHW